MDVMEEMNIIYENDMFYVTPAENKKGYEVVNKETGVTEFEHGFQWLCRNQADHLQMSLSAWNQQRMKASQTFREGDIEAAEQTTDEFWKKIKGDLE